MRNWLQSPLLRRQWLLLLLGMLVAGLAISFWAQTYQRLLPKRLPKVQIVNRVNAAIRLVEGLDQKKAHKALRDLNYHGLRFTILQQENVNAVTMLPFQRAKLKDYLQQYKSINIPLNDGSWLLVQQFQANNTLFRVGFASVLVLIILALLAWTIFVMRALAFPLHEFVKASKRLARDMQAPPLPEAGPTEMRAAIAAFNQMQDRLRQLLSDRTQMLAAISHDMRTPITRIKLRCEAVKDPELATKITRDLNEMERMIDSIVAFVRDHSQTEAQQSFDINALLQTICDDFVDLGKDVEYSSAQRLAFSGRMLSLKRALSNIIDNAIKYGQRAEVSMRKCDKILMISVRDHGPGIAEQDLERVFQPFYRLDPSRSMEIAGSGLGLAVARDIVRAHGGEITVANVANDESGGLIVRIALPMH